MQIGKSSLLATLAAGYLVVSFAAPPTAAAVQQWLSISHAAVFDNSVGGLLVLPGGSLDPEDLLAGLAASAKLIVSTHVMVTQSSQVTSTLPVTNSVEIKATVPGKKRPKLVARLKGTLALGEVMLSKQITAKKLIGKGILTFEITTAGARVERYQATVVYELERASTSSSRR